MEIRISNNRYLHEVQEEFHKEYPFLKIEFFRNINRAGISARKHQIIPGKLTIGMIRRSQAEGFLHIDDSRSVAEVESDLKNLFDLDAEVYRKSGNMWIETPLTRHWSLRRQDQEGLQMTKYHLS